MKIISVVGGRPNFIKLAAISNRLPKEFTHLILHSGQHYDYLMSQAFFEELKLPKSNKNLNVGSQSHANQVAKILVGCEEYFNKVKPDLVIVYGDMNSTLAASLAAAKLNIPVAHVESGLRSFDRSMPEELNRIMVDHVSRLLFSPTGVATVNLKKEGLIKFTFESGDTTYDSFLEFEKRISIKYLKKRHLDQGQYYVVTVHRQSNTDNPKNLKAILEALIDLGKPIVFAIHPRTEKIINRFRLQKFFKNTNMIRVNPVSYIESLSLQKHSRAILTDSGGVQREAYYLKKPCVVLRDTTEYPKLISLGSHALWFPNKVKLPKIISSLKIPDNRHALFGDGRAGVKIANSIEKFLKRQ